MSSLHDLIVQSVSLYACYGVVNTFFFYYTSVFQISRNKDLKHNRKFVFQNFIHGGNLIFISLDLHTLSIPMFSPKRHTLKTYEKLYVHRVRKWKEKQNVFYRQTSWGN